MSSNTHLSHALTVVEGVTRCWNEGQFTDSVLSGGGGARVNCHLIVLSNASRLLEELLREHSNTADEDVCVILPGLDEHQLDHLLRFIYTGSVDLKHAQGAGQVVQVLRALQVPLTMDLDMLRLCDRIEQEVEQRVKMVLPPSCPLTTRVQSELVGVSQEPEMTIKSEGQVFTHMQESYLKSDNENKVETTYLCDLCNTNFSSKLLLQIHKEKEHEVFVCDVCDKRTNSEESLNSHKGTHKSAKNFKCTHCDHHFRWRAEYRRHAETVHGQLITDMTICTVCNKQVVSKRLNEHIKTVHGTEKPFQCKQCVKKFSKPSELKNHMRFHTGERPFACDICNANFAYSHILTRHKKYHEGAKKFSCNVCSKSFLQKNDLVKHNRIHTGEKPYKCEMCSKDFARMDYLRKHQMLHSSDTKFCCNECKELCGSLDGLKKHKKHQHSANQEKCHEGGIDITSFEDLGFQLPNIYGGDSGLEPINELQAVSLDGGKTIMILNESEHPVYTEVRLQEESLMEDPGGGQTTLLSHTRMSGTPQLVISTQEKDIRSHDNVDGGGSVLLQDGQLGTFVEPQEVLYAVEY